MWYELKDECRVGTADALRVVVSSGCLKSAPFYVIEAQRN